MLKSVELLHRTSQPPMRRVSSRFAASRLNSAAELSSGFATVAADSVAVAATTPRVGPASVAIGQKQFTSWASHWAIGGGGGATAVGVGVGTIAVPSAVGSSLTSAVSPAVGSAAVGSTTSASASCSSSAGLTGVRLQGLTRKPFPPSTGNTAQRASHPGESSSSSSLTTVPFRSGRRERPDTRARLFGEKKSPLTRAVPPSGDSGYSAEPIAIRTSW
mmetsp:Transcript_43860/g.99145  ORF Transcript_43860/g.99145 Transcript_43860/m.99145 type:complete len:218 (+) Transcript_43860:788-1441(+)